MSGAVLFCPLYFFPVRPDLRDICDLQVAKNMRVSSDQLVGNVASHFVKIESAAFLRELAMEDNLQQQIPNSSSSS